MKVLYWSEGFWPNIGGLEVLSMHMLKGLQNLGHEFVIVTTSVVSGSQVEPTYLGMPVFRLPMHEALFSRDVRAVASAHQRVVEIMRTFQPDLVHLNAAGIGMFFVLRALRAVPTPTLAAFHSVMPSASQVGLQEQILQKATWVAGVSQSMLDQLLARSPEIVGHSSVVYNGLLEPDLAPAPLPFDPPRVLCLGRLVHEKGFDVALAAFARVIQRVPGIQLTVAGDGEYRDVLEQQAARLNIVHAVHFTGWVSPDCTPRLMNEATCVVMPSRWKEPFGLVALEAAQMARPLVGTRAGALPEIVVHGETGLLVENENSQELADAIISVLEQRELAVSMGLAAQRRAREIFSFERCVSAYDALYHHTVALATGVERPA